VASANAELNLILRARDLASGTVSSLGDTVRDVGPKLDTVTGKAERLRAKLERTFDKKAYKRFASTFGNLVSDLLTGGDIQTTLTNFAANFVGVGIAAGTSFVLGMGGNLVKKIGGSALWATISGTLGALGSSIGAFIAAAIPVGMALMPALLLAALGAAIIYLVNNPQIVHKAIAVAGGIIKGVVAGLATLGAKLAGIFSAAFNGVLGIVVRAVANIIGAIQGVISWVKRALAWLGTLADANRKEGLAIVGRSNERGDYSGGRVPGHAAGGWAGLHGPELAILGEKGPEYVMSNREVRGSSNPNYELVAVGKRDLARMIDEQLYFTLRRAAPTSGRV
jgi:hypothetical protein